jgi:SAM-dependent methyltransferase
MVMTEPQRHSSDVLAAKRAVVWHDLECGAYRADMPLWRELAQDAREQAPPGAILDIGAGSGRVSLDLARVGAEVTALDIDPALLGALEQRAGSTAIQTACADARDFELERSDFALCISPMQTIQLLGGPEGRIAFLRRTRAHLRPGGLLACAIVTELEPFDCTAGGPGPSPESTRIDGVLYVSRAVRVQLTRQLVRIERERSIFPTGQREPPGRPSSERNLIELDRLSASRLRRDARAAGLLPAGTRTIAATDEHVGSLVVMFRA